MPRGVRPLAMVVSVTMCTGVQPAGRTCARVTAGTRDQDPWPSSSSSSEGHSWLGGGSACDGASNSMAARFAAARASPLLAKAAASLPGSVAAVLPNTASSADSRSTSAEAAAVAAVSGTLALAAASTLNGATTV